MPRIIIALGRHGKVIDPFRILVAQIASFRPTVAGF